MSVSALDAACQDLQRAWFLRDYGRCAAVLTRILSTPATTNDAHALGVLGAAMLAMTADGPDDEALDQFRDLRADVLRRAATRDTGVLTTLFADEVATRGSEQDWANSLLNYIMLRSEAVGQNKARLWETVAFVHWGAARLLETCQLEEMALISLFVALRRVGVHLDWEITEPSFLKTVMQDERSKLQDRLVQQVMRLAQAGTMREPEVFIQFDSDARLVPVLASAALKLGARHPNSAALYYFLVYRGEMDTAAFLQGVAKRPFFVITPRRCLIVAGDYIPDTLCRTLVDQSDGVERPLHLTWWVNVDFPREQLGNPVALASRIPLFVRALLNHQKASVVLCATGEASWFSPRWVGWMSALTEVLSCRPEQLLYLPQNARFGEDLAAFARGSGSSAAFKVIPFNSHLLIGGLRAAPAQANPSKRFLCFNQRSHLHRAALLLNCYRDGMLDEMHLSFNQPIRAEFPLCGEALEPWMQSPAAAIDRLIEEAETLLPLRLDLVGSGVASATDGNYVGQFNARLFADSAIYLVTETEMEGRAMCRFTEKTVKGLAAEIPFIVFGSAGTLASLRDLGFRTFSPLIDESYDEIEDPVARFRRAYAEVRRLHAMPMPALLAVRHVLQPVLQHNRQHLLGIEPLLHERLAQAFEATGNRHMMPTAKPAASVVRRYSAASCA